jgi:hypothetical protein
MDLNRGHIFPHQVERLFAEPKISPLDRTRLHGTSKGGG